MSRVAIWAQLEAKPGKEKEVEEFLKSAQPLAERERETLSWYAIKLGPGKYGIFDTFADDHGRNAHLNGEIATALFAACCPTTYLSNSATISRGVISSSARA